MNDAMSATVLRPKDPRAVPVRSLLLWGGLAVVIGLVAVLAAAALRGPKFVSGVTINNPSPYVVTVDVAPANSSEWTELSAISPNTTTSVSQIVDQGRTWVFRVASAGVDGGVFSVSRNGLAQAGWKVTIPASVIARLRAQNVSDAPPVDF
jgi:hypothetical protein